MTNLIMLATDAAAEAGGYTISIVSIIVVFISLGILVFIFMGLPKILELKIKEILNKKGDVATAPQPAGSDADVNAAIAMGLYMYLNESHDEESNILTIRKATKQYSPWNSKIYGVQNQPMRK